MEKKHRITYNSSKEQSFMVHLPNKTVRFSKSFNGLYYHKPRYNTNMSNDKVLVNHTIIPITTPTTNFIHVMIAGVDDNIKIAGVDDNIKITRVARNTTNNNDTNKSKLVEFSKGETSKTLVEFMKNHIQAKKPKKTTITTSKTVYKTRLL
jgi:hypothetical protein